MKLDLIEHQPKVLYLLHLTTGLCQGGARSGFQWAEVRADLSPACGRLAARG